MMSFLTIAYQNHVCSQSLWCFSGDEFMVMNQPSRHGPDFHRPQSQITIDSPDFHLRRSQNCLLGTHHLKNIISFDCIYGFDRLASRITSFFHWFWWVVGNAVFTYAGPLNTILFYSILSLIDYLSSEFFALFYPPFFTFLLHLFWPTWYLALPYTSVTLHFFGFGKLFTELNSKDKDKKTRRLLLLCFQR